MSAPQTTKLSGLLLIPYFSDRATCFPKTVGTEVNAPPPAASVNKSFPTNTYEILSSCKVKISSRLPDNFSIGPNESSSGL